MVSLEMLMICVGIPFTAVTGTLGAAAGIAGCLAVARRRGWSVRTTWRVLAAWTLGVAVVAFAVSAVNLTIMSYDSHYMVIMGGAIGRDGTIDPAVLPRLGDYGVFTVFAQSLMCFTRESYLWAMPPMLAASTIALFALMLGMGLDALNVRLRHRGLVIALVTATTFTSFMFVNHSFYIQTNLGTTAYLLAFATLQWWSEVTDDRSALPLAFVALFAMTLHRIEAPTVAVLIMALAILPGRIPLRATLVPLTVMTIGVAAWYVVLAAAVSETSQFLTPSRCYLMAAILVSFNIYVAASASGKLPWLESVNRRAPLLVITALTLALAWSFATHYELMSQSARDWLHCLVAAPYWGRTWIAIVAFGLLGLAVPAPPARTLFVVGIPAYMAEILILVLFRTQYYFGIADSATRMSLHLVPLAFFYFGLKFVPLLQRPSTGAEDAE
jgi:hypothetical protein